MKKKGFSQLDTATKRVIFDGLSYYEELKTKKLFVSKQKDFSFDTEYVLLDQEDLKVISLLLGILSTDNYMTGYLNTKGINRETVLKYLNVEDFVLEPIKLSEVNINLNVFSFLRSLMEKELNVDNLALTLFKKFECDSDIVYNFYFTMISSEISEYNNIKDELKKNTTNENPYLTAVDFKLLSVYN